VTQSKGSPEENKMALFENAELAGDDILKPSCQSIVGSDSSSVLRVRHTQTTLTHLHLGQASSASSYRHFPHLKRCLPAVEQMGNYKDN
jgi:hypothetical protein